MEKPRNEKKMQKLADKVAEKALKENYPLETQRTLHLIQQHDLVGVMMAKAKEQGEFDNLEGEGKPLSLAENPFEPDELHMVHKILKDNGYAPYWIELSKEIDLLWVKLNQEVDHFKKYTKIFFGGKRSSVALKRYEQKKKDFYIQVRENLEEISKKILDYNLHCPVLHLGRANFNLENEMDRIVEDIETLCSNFFTMPQRL
ncbi:MAG TPA: DnaJ family domain-containing protein [Syntrophomonadaceae bacterium]|nr:DnaJ family domain-containing protein [Syntrophomonadaceae bacterium]